MSAPSLPPELLSELFQFITSPNDLALLSYCSKTFSIIVQPLLYSHVRIETKHNRLGLPNISQEATKLIKKVSIFGNDRVWSLKVHKLDAHFDGETNTTDIGGGEKEKVVCKLGGGCVRDLLEGKLVKTQGKQRLYMSTLVHALSLTKSIFLGVETIIVRDIHEQPRIEISRPTLQPSLFRNLHTLSIISHRGGSPLWIQFLDPKNVPSLRRLTMYDITLFESPTFPASRQYQQEGTTILSFRSNVPYLEALEESEGGGRNAKVAEFPHVEEVLVTRNELLQQLEILVFPWIPSLEYYGVFSHLAIIAEDSYIEEDTKYAIMLIGNNVFSEALDDIYMQLENIVNPIDKNKKYALEYLSLQNFVKGLYDQGIFEEVLDGLVEKGIKVIYDADENSELIPQSFVDYLDEKKGKK
ncbi:hypothetical protein JCM5350_007059 [Sporobolomyces pararoseus]